MTLSRPRAGLAALLLLACPLPACRQAPVLAHYDLARDAPFAEHLYSGGIRAILAPPAAVHRGFRFDEGDEEGDATRFERQVFLEWLGVAPRHVALDVEPSPGGAEPSATVFLNDEEVTRIALADGRRQYEVALPAEKQKRRSNILRLVFASGAGSGLRDPPARLHAVAVGPEEGAPSPVSIVESGGVPSLVQGGPSRLRYAIRVPDGAQLRLTPELPPRARQAGAAVRFRATLEEPGGPERELWSRELRPSDSPPGEVVVALPGRPGRLARLTLHVEGAWGIWRAPRVMGRGEAPRFELSRAGEAGGGTAETLRRSLAGSSVLLVILDAASARHFRTYGYPRPTTPEIDRLAAEGVVFERAYTPAPFTLSAMASVWTSRYPDQHHDGVRHSDALPPGQITVAEVLASAGVRTAGFVANPSAGRPFGLHRGFGEFHDLYTKNGRFAGVPRAGDMRAALEAWLGARRSERFFAYAHFLEPHFPYDPRPPFDTLFGPEGPLPRAGRRDPTWMRSVNAGKIRATAAESDHLVRLYDGNLALVDHDLGRLRRALEEAGLWERMVVIVSADHGEALGEHGFIGHGPQLYEEAVRIPLVVRFPKGKGPERVRVSGLVDLLDVGPTILDVFGLLGRGGTDGDFEGQSLLAVATGAPGKPAVFSRTMAERPLYSVTDGRFKLIHSVRRGTSELFDLEKDPLEREDLADREPIRVELYRMGLYRWLAGLRRGDTPTAEETQLTDAEREALRALGYVQ